jgi:hypothetical protein
MNIDPLLRFSTATLLSLVAFSLLEGHAYCEDLASRIPEIHDRLVAAKDELKRANVTLESRSSNPDETNFQRDVPWFTTWVLPAHLEMFAALTGNLTRYQVIPGDARNDGLEADESNLRAMLESLVCANYLPKPETFRESCFKGIPASATFPWPAGGLDPVEFVRLEGERNGIFMRAELLWRCSALLIVTGNEPFGKSKPPSGESIKALVTRYLKVPPRPWDNQPYDYTAHVLKTVDGVTLAVLYKDALAAQKSKANDGFLGGMDGITWQTRVPLITDGSFIYVSSTPWANDGRPLVTQKSTRVNNW